MQRVNGIESVFVGFRSLCALCIFGIDQCGLKRGRKMLIFKKKMNKIQIIFILKVPEKYCCSSNYLKPLTLYSESFKRNYKVIYLSGVE